MKTIILIFVLLVTTCLYSTIINVPADQPTIQEGINVAVDTDTVLVQPGTYYEHINYNGKNITVASLFLTTQDTTYISQTIIDGNENGRVVRFLSGEDLTAFLIGFTIINGSAGYGGSGGGIYCVGSSPNLVNITIIGNSAFGGGGICCENNSSPNLANVIISDNLAWFGGGGIRCNDNSSPSLENVTISGNSADSGGGISCIVNSNPSLENVTITGNSAYSVGGGIYCYDYESNPSLVNCIMWNDSPEEIYINSGSITIAYSDIQGGWAGEGNIDEDPLFVNPIEENYHLQDSSPCIGTGIDEIEISGIWYYAPEFDIEGNPRPDPVGSIPDMGAYENPYGEPQIGIEDLLLVKNELNNYPNPFNPTTTINYSLKENSKVSLKIYNIKGQKVKQLVSEQFLAGQHSVVWKGKDDSGKQVSSGIYFYKLKTVNFEKVRKMILIK